MVRSSNFTAKGIQLHGKLFLWRTKQPQRKIFNHSEIKFSEWFYGARSHVRTTTLEGINREFDNPELKEYRIPVSSEGYDKALKYAQDQLGKLYEYSNFWWHI